MLIGALLDELEAAALLVEVRSDDLNPRELRQIEIHDVVHDSRQAGPGVVFCAVPGATVDGHDFVGSAVARGAAAVLVERFGDVAVPQLRAANVRAAMAETAAAVHGRPSTHLDVVGITGTNGKTTTTHLLASILRTAGTEVEVIGTLSGVHTTPESTDLQRRLRDGVARGVGVVAAEISSHALDQHRADAIEFAVAAFSNLTPDHLDYHGDMESYFAAKARLFDGRARHELINIDDPWGRRLAERRPGARRLTLTDVSVTHADLRGTTFEWRGAPITLPIPGQMNVANALMAAESAALLDVDDDTIRRGLSTAPQVPGRMEIVPNPHGARTVIVDYSHTPDSITRALETIRASAGSAEVSIVFGCGGDRDRAKRPLMARAAEAADRVIVTSDNPRSEDPDGIIDDAMAGLAEPNAALRNSDRRAAIVEAISGAAPDGVVLIAGKGHERTQTIGDRVLPFDDVKVAAEVLEDLDS